MIFGVKQMKIMASVGLLPEEELAEQELAIDVAVESDRDDINEYFFKEMAEVVAEKGHETLQKFALALYKRLEKEAALSRIELSVTKTSSPIGIPTYVTLKHG